MFLVYDDNTSNKQWLYFVKPCETKCINSNDISFLAANHFTFCYDKSDKNKKCHFHSTEYDCKVMNSIPVYRAMHRRDFMPDVLNLLDDYNSIFTKHTDDKPYLIKLIEYPWHQEVIL